MRRSRIAFALLAGIAVCCGVLASCTSKRPGELVVVVTTDLSVPKDIDALHVDVIADGNSLLKRQDYPLGQAGLSLPATLGIVAGPKTTTPVTIEVSGLLRGNARVSRTAIVTLPTDRVATLAVPLDFLCVGASSCSSGETCQAGACVSVIVPKDAVPASGSDGGAEDGGGACFDTKACFASATLWPGLFGTDCTVPKPTGGTGVNVALVVTSGDGICGSGSCLIALDAESAEGWQTSADGTRIDLPPVVCTNAGVAAVEVSTSCPTKRASAAICPGMGDSMIDAGCAKEADGGCAPSVVGGSPPDAGITCALDAGAGAVLIDDMSGTTQIKLDIGQGTGTKGWWYPYDDGTGSMYHAPCKGFSYAPVLATPTCEPPLASAACMQSLTPYQLFAGMGFDFKTSGTNPVDCGAAEPVSFPVSAYKAIRFWAKASDGKSQRLSIQFADAPNNGNYPGAVCVRSPPLKCFNYYQYTQTLTSTWQRYDIDFDLLTQLLTNADGFFTTNHFDRSLATGITFQMIAFAPDGGLPSMDAGPTLTFDVCVADIYFVPL